MSFASQAREEIAQRSLQLQKDCCVRDKIKKMKLRSHTQHKPVIYYEQ